MEIKEDYTKEFKPKSTFFPYWEKGPFIETFSKIITQEFDEIDHKEKRRGNLKKKEIEALKNLKERKKWIIKAADKGGEEL